MKILKKPFALVKKGMDDSITVYAAQSAYYLMLSVIPFIMLLLSVIQFFVPLDKAAIHIPTMLSPELKAFFTGIMNEIFEQPGFSLISASAAAILWSVSRGFSAIERGVRQVYGIPKRKFFVWDILLSFLYTLIFTVMIALFLLIIVFGSAVLAVAKMHVPWADLNVSILKYAMFFGASIAFFTILYAGFTGKKIRMRNHLPGAVFTGTGWVLFSYIFSIYINNFANYSRIYGSLTAIVLMMLWLYSCMIILLYGAEVNVWILERKTR